MSPCGSDHIFTSLVRGGWRLASEDSWLRLSRIQTFPADCPHRALCHRVEVLRGSAGFTGFPAYGQLPSRDRSREGQTRSTFRASTLGPFVCCYSRQLVGGAVISAALSTSPWRPDYPITTRASRVRRLVSEDSRMLRGSLRRCIGGCRRRSCRNESEGSPRPAHDPSVAHRPGTPRVA